MNYKTEFEIQQLRTKKLTRVVCTISVFVAAVIANMLVPQLLIKYVYDPTTLVEAPPIFEYFPLASYSLALLYFLYAMAINFSSEQKAKRMERELALYPCDCKEGCNCSDEDEISEDELKELEKIVDEALKPKKKSGAKAAKKSTKKSTRKVAKKK